MFYLKYRPKTVDELDNAAVATSIKNYLASPSIPHAWLLVGHKGMGKTSVARIIAKSLNPEETQAIEQGNAADVQEINGADNTGIEDVRQLIENVSYSPLSGKYRIYIIDEVHMLSASAFNGLLKTLEEPPAHAIFILATTNIDKIPATIRSRCVQIDFGRAKKADLIHMLKRICVGEGIKMGDDVLEFIATHCDDSFRDAAKILEELHTQKKTSLEDAQTYLGLRGQESLLHMIEQSDMKKMIHWLEKYAEGGGDVRILIQDTIDELHTQIVASATGDKKSTSLELASMVRLMKLLHEAYNAVRYAPEPIIPLEIAVIEFHETKK